ncbi:serglycin, partial [Diachasma alloeum]|uniref:serglycin n=1 Tax=Diachasma alloeum TaxID=454923 RepID=UPI00073815B9
MTEEQQQNAEGGHSGRLPGITPEIAQFIQEMVMEQLGNLRGPPPNPAFQGRTTPEGAGSGTAAGRAGGSGTGTGAGGGAGAGDGSGTEAGGGDGS